MHASRPGRDGFVAPELHEVDLPAGYRAVTDPAEVLALLDELPAATAGLYANGLASRRAVWRALVEHLHESGTVVAGHRRLAERAHVHAGRPDDRPFGRSTVGNHIRALEAAMVLHVAVRGASKQALGSDRDRAPVYVFIAPVDHVSTAVPAVPLDPAGQDAVDELAARLATATTADRAMSSVDEYGHLPEGSAHFSGGLDGTHPRKTTYFPSSDHMPRSQTKSKAEPATPARRANPGRFAPRSAADRRVAVAYLAAVMGWPWKKRTEQELAKITGPWFSAGWSPDAVVKALRSQPDGMPWPGPLPEPHQRDRRDPIRIRNLWAVLTHRLQAWTDPLGQPLDPPIPTQTPRRGRPPGPDAHRRALTRLIAQLPADDPRREAARIALGGPEPTPPRRQRPAAVDAQLAALAARRAAAAAERDAAEAARQARLARYGPAPRLTEPDPEPPAAPADRARARAIFRARIERQHRNRP
ncbi:hypothetical protein [Polymorphospora sp. NPDC050346]|uniref:hypothetical protein n=1 Tax=Polymorphospora sp. NPDC050346 TaxID=3155780 RepID=UPI00340F4E4F